MNSRLPQLDPDKLSVEQQRVYDQITAGPRAAVVGPLRVWLQSPKFAEKAQALGQYSRFDSVLPTQLSEIAILVTARCWSSGFEWSHHAPIALAAGVPAEAVAAIARAEGVTFSDEKMQCVFDAAVELHRDRKISDDTYAHALAVLGLQGCVDLVGVCGYYTLISMTINVFDVPGDDTVALPVLDSAFCDYFRS